MPTANTTELLQSLKGLTIIGVIRGYDRHTHSEFHIDMLILSNGTGFCFNSNGGFWIQSREDVQRALDVLKSEYETAVSAQKTLLELAGSL